jgi:uncharacterized membrane protein HdeD (DUF308 family)
MNPMQGTPLSPGEAEEISHAWWIVLLTGLITAITGILILRIHWTVSGLAIFLGILLIVSGLGSIFSPTFTGGPRTTSALPGILEAGVGIALIVWPGPGLTVIATFFGIWLLVGGMIDIAGALSNRDHSSWWLVLLLGIFQFAIGIWALNRPGLTLQVLIALSGIWALVVGLLQVVLAFELRKLGRTAAASAGALAP